MKPLKKEKVFLDEIFAFSIFVILLYQQLNSSFTSTSCFVFTT